jgi:hypothetical protein
MKKKTLAQTNPYLKNPQKSAEQRLRSLASSTAIETGEPISELEEKIKQLRIHHLSVTLA